jgi:hypothetical protein
LDTARFAIEVVAGVLPGTPEPELTRRWAVSSTEWREANDAGKGAELLANRSGQAAAYAALLQLQPDRLNWVKTEWIWF